MFVTPEQLVDFTHKVRPSAQARFLADRGLVFTVRDDGTIALRREELDRVTLGQQPTKGRQRPTLDLSLLRRAG